ncbi:CheY-like chemotaxis protein [Stenotrophomonas sp. SORGH_AS321]|nr:CheY-like chemotaxis protein [Stenotrophomonas sp. SORGH_AS_0321]
MTFNGMAAPVRQGADGSGSARGVPACLRATVRAANRSTPLRHGRTGLAHESRRRTCWRSRKCDIDTPSQRRRPKCRAWGTVMTENMTAGGELAGLRVMVIDDSKTIRRTAETLLKREGCEVVTATDGFEALAKIADQQPQIIFVDIMMPRLDGYQTCALIKGNQLFKSTPVIMLSSKDGLFDKARGRIVGSEQYLTKPFTREELLGAIRTYVNA